MNMWVSVGSDGKSGRTLWCLRRNLHKYVALVCESEGKLMEFERIDWKSCGIEKKSSESGDWEGGISKGNLVGHAGTLLGVQGNAKSAGI